MNHVLDYISRTTPALVLVVIVFGLIRPTRNVRVLLYIFTFILLRDALTPSALWRLGMTDGIPWIRFFPSHLFLTGMGISSLGLVALLVFFDKENSRGVFLRKGQAVQGWFSALLGLVVLLGPILLIYRRVDIQERGGLVDAHLLGAILVFALFGNLLEELLFRGYVSNLLKKKEADLRAGITSGFVFSLCHAFLATTVTSVGVPVLLFTLWVGLICGIVGAKYGVLPATIVRPSCTAAPSLC